MGIIPKLCAYFIIGFSQLSLSEFLTREKESIRDILKQLCDYKGVEILEGKLMVDHVHMLVTILPKYSISQFMGYLKAKSALMIFDRHANLKYKYGYRHFWAEGYYVSTVGLNEATIRKYYNLRQQFSNFQWLPSVSAPGCFQIFLRKYPLASGKHNLFWR